MIKNLLDLEQTKVSCDLKDYSMMIVGESGIGKTELAVDIYGRDRTLVLAFESSISGISDIYGVEIDSYSTLMSYLLQLQNPSVREKFDTIVIDTIFLLDHYIEKSITDAYNVDILSDALKYNKAYKIVDKRFLDILKKLQKMGYTLCYIAHPAMKKVKVRENEIETYVPKVSDRVKNLLLPEVDIRLFCFTDENNDRKIATRKSFVYPDARCRVAELSPVIDFNAKTLHEEFKKAMTDKSEKGGTVVAKKEKEKEESASFEELMNKVKELGQKATEKNKVAEANKILASNLGRTDDGTPRKLSDITPTMTETLKVIVLELENLLK